ncbi:MAG: peptidylprolyl isomerase [Sinobacteraceae bacterium]|nr:peptidylprolyl isomerase [Nevskiaceae bacterium]
MSSRGAALVLHARRCQGRLAVGLLCGLLFGLFVVCGGRTASAAPVPLTELLENSTAADWRSPDPENLLYLQLRVGLVIIELAPRMAPAHVQNIRELARAHYFDGLAIVRVQDNFVVQWNDPRHQRALPPGIHKVAAEFTLDRGAGADFIPLRERDVYAEEVGFLDGFPAARDPQSGAVWLAHCYGMVGVGRDDPPQSDGTEMYAVIGQSPRQLDRNLALVGRVVKGIALLATLPRGSGESGFYLPSEAPMPIVSMRVGADVPVAEQIPIQVLRTDTRTFHRLLEQRRNRREDWFKFNPGHIDLCNVPLPVRIPVARTSRQPRVESPGR